MNPTSTGRTGRIVVIDDDEAARESLGQMFGLRGYDVEVFASAETALAWPGLADSECIVVDVKMPGMDGEEFLSTVTQRGLQTPIIVVTGHADISMAVRCLKGGAYDFVEKPFDQELLLASVDRALDMVSLRRESEELRRRVTLLPHDEIGRFGLVGKSRAMQDIYEQIDTYAKSEAPVLIVGETGSGKELVARAIHAQSKRAKGPFVPVNAGALPESMLESELFGHARGAFTGALAERDGKLISSSGGTLLLDEIEALSLRAQVQLLRVLEDATVYPVGSDKSRRVDLRILVTSKVDLREEVRQGRMREDFYHRVAVVSLNVPPLRERPEDIPLLISHFLRLACERTRTTTPRIDEKSLVEMQRHPWYGNVRELRNAIERMVIVGQDGVAGSFTEDASFGSERLLSLPATAGLLREEMERTEKAVIESALREHKGGINVTCLALGISRRALYERMKKYGLHKDDFKP